MEKLSKFDWLKAVNNGFVPHNEVKKTSHGRYYYIMGSDYRRYVNFMSRLDNEGKRNN